MLNNGSTWASTRVELIVGRPKSAIIITIKVLCQQFQRNRPSPRRASIVPTANDMLECLIAWEPRCFSESFPPMPCGTFHKTFVSRNTKYRAILSFPPRHICCSERLRGYPKLERLEQRLSCSRRQAQEGLEEPYHGYRRPRHSRTT